MESRLGNAMVTFDVDFEMYGKDLTESAILSIKFAGYYLKNSTKWICL